MRILVSLIHTSQPIFYTRDIKNDFSLPGGICSVVPYITVKKYVLGTLLTIALMVAVLYVCDYLVAQYRAAHGNPDAIYGTVSVYLASEMKNGSVQLYYRAPQPTRCTYSIFPQLGYTPCWYLSRSTVKLIQ
jgi:hypothetical protein